MDKKMIEELKLRCERGDLSHRDYQTYFPMVCDALIKAWKSEDHRSQLH